MVAKDLYALSALTRNNAGALKALMDADGLALIATTAAAESRPGGSACKVRVKSIAFMADLLASTETDRRQGSYDVQSVDAAHVEDTEVIDALGRPEWCNLVIGSLPLCDSPVWQEKVLHGMAQLKAKSMVSYVCVCVCVCVSINTFILPCMSVQCLCTWWRGSEGNRGSKKCVSTWMYIFNYCNLTLALRHFRPLYV